MLVAHSLQYAYSMHCLFLKLNNLILNQGQRKLLKSGGGQSYSWITSIEQEHSILYVIQKMGNIYIPAFKNTS